MFNIASIPTNALIDNEGKILEWNLTGEKLSKIFNKNWVIPDGQPLAECICHSAGSIRHKHKRCGLLPRADASKY